MSNQYPKYMCIWFKIQQKKTFFETDTERYTRINQQTEGQLLLTKYTDRKYKLIPHSDRQNKNILVQLNIH